MNESDGLGRGAFLKLAAVAAGVGTVEALGLKVREKEIPEVVRAFFLNDQQVEDARKSMGAWTRVVEGIGQSPDWDAHPDEVSILAVGAVLKGRKGTQIRPYFLVDRRGRGGGISIGTIVPGESGEVRLAALESMDVVVGGQPRLAIGLGESRRPVFIFGVSREEYTNMTAEQRAGVEVGYSDPAYAGQARLEGASAKLARLVESNRAEVDLEDRFLVNQVKMEELIAKSDGEVLSIAPRLDGEKYGLGGNLTASEVLRMGKEGNVPYVLYTDTEGKIAMAWNVEQGRVEYCQMSEYTDPETGFRSRVFTVTDYGWIEKGKKRWDVKPASDEAMAKAFFDYTLALNNMHTNHRNEFLRAFGITNENNFRVAITKMEDGRILEIIERFRKTLADDLKQLGDADTIKVKLGRNGRGEFDKRGADIQMRMVYSGSRSNVGMWVGGYADMGFFNVSSRPNNNVLIEVRTDLNYLSYPGTTDVGGIPVTVMRQITFGSGVNTTSITWEEDASTSKDPTSGIAVEVCGKAKIERYLQELGHGFSLSAIPVWDDFSPAVPTCVTMVPVDSGR